MPVPTASAPRARRGVSLAALALGAGLLALAGCTDESGAPAGEAATMAPAAGAAPAATTPAEPAARAVTPSAQAPEAEGTVDVAALMEPGPLPDVVIGDPNAPVTIVEYASATCSHCADYHASAWPAIKADYVDTGKAKVIVREFPFSGDTPSLAAFMLARCAGSEDPTRRTRMLDVLFDQQDTWARSPEISVALLSIAKLAGMSEEQFRACLADGELQANVVATQQRGLEEFGVQATPTFFVDGDKHAGALSAADMAAIIEAKLADAS